MTGRKRDVKPVKVSWVHASDYVIDYVTGETITATPDYFFASPIPHRLGLDENTPTIDRLFHEWVGDNATLLYEICAYCLVPNYSIHRLFLLFGRGRNGKGQFLKLLSKFIGHSNTTGIDLDKITDSRFEASKLYRKKVALVGETNFAVLKSTARLKQITGDDLITAEYKHKDPFDFTNTAKVIIATNSLPETLDKTDGFYSRCIILEFKNQFDEGIDAVDLIPEVEFENLLAKCLKILPGLLERGRFTGEGTIEDKAVKYERLSNPFPTFKSKELIEGSEHECPVWVLREAYEVFCAKNGFRKVGEREFTQLLHREGFETKKRWYGLNGKKYWNTVFGLNTKTPFIYSDDTEYEQVYNDCGTEKNSGSKNQDAEPDEPLEPHVLYNPSYMGQSKTCGSSGSSGSFENIFNLSEPDANQKLRQSLMSAIRQFERQYGGINSENIARFSYWFCEQVKPKWKHGTESGVYTPEMILPIARRVFKLTPPLPTPLTSTVAVMKHHATDVLIVVADDGNSQGQNSQICYTCGTVLPDKNGHTNTSESALSKKKYYCDSCFFNE